MDNRTATWKWEKVRAIFLTSYEAEKDPAERAVILTELEAVRQAEVAELRERLAWYESDEALELFKAGHMMYPEVTVACLRKRLAELEG